MNSADVNQIMIAFLIIFSSFFVVFGGIKFFFFVFEKFVADAFKKPPKGNQYG